MSFKEINFGKSSAEIESYEFPELLLEGYLDKYNYTNEAICGNKYLFLGYKGSGKTALAEHIRLISEKESTIFVKKLTLSDFPYKRFSDMIKGNSELEVKFPTAWSWLLLLVILDSFGDDNGAEFEDFNYFNTVTDSYRKIGLLPAKNFNELIYTTSKKSVKTKLPYGFEINIDKKEIDTEDIRFIHLVDNLKKLLSSFKSPSKHIMIIDGLDEILTGTSIQYHSIYSLISESLKLNIYFKKTNTPAKIVILCRTDLFERLPAPNKNKIRQDCSLELNWFSDPQNPCKSELITLANLRANLSTSGNINIFDKYFPETMYKKDIYRYLLEYTRHTPRDFLQLLIHIQKYYENGCLSFNQIKSGIRDYSISYFFPEIRDEMVGYIQEDVVDNIFKLISNLNSNKFYLAEIDKCKNDIVGLEKVKLIEVFNVLFDCSAIGHCMETESNSFYTFKFRNRQSNFNPKEKVVLHLGLLKALNVSIIKNHNPRLVRW
jgi:hypothetical protein